MTFPAEKTLQLFSWNEYKEWPEDERWQIRGSLWGQDLKGSLWGQDLKT